MTGGYGPPDEGSIPSTCTNRILLSKEYIMELKLMLLKARAAMLEQRGPHNNAIVAHIKRRIRNIENSTANKI